MQRRKFIALVGGTVAIWPLAARSQQRERVYRVGYLSAPSRESVQRALDAFLRKLRELRWVEGSNLVIEYRWADGEIARLPPRRPLVGARPDTAGVRSRRREWTRSRASRFEGIHERSLLC